MLAVTPDLTSLVLFGGQNSQSGCIKGLTDTWIFDLGAQTWRSVAQLSAPTGLPHLSMPGSRYMGCRRQYSRAGRRNDRMHRANWPRPVDRALNVFSIASGNMDPAAAGL